MTPVHWIGVGMVTLGIALACVDTQLMPWFARAIAAAFWGQAEMPAEVVPYHRWLHGAMGGVIAGWGATMWVVAGRRHEPWVALGAGLVTWFLIDSAASAFHGAWPNVLLNIVALGLGTGGLAFAARSGPSS